MVEMLSGLMQGADRDLVKVWQRVNIKPSTCTCSRTSLGPHAKRQEDRHRLQR